MCESMYLMLANEVCLYFQDRTLYLLCMCVFIDYVYIVIV